MINRVLVFGDDFGLSQSIKYFPARLICGIVVAEIRPLQHETLKNLAEKLRLPFIIQPRVSSPDYPAFVEKVRQLKPDLIFVNSYSMLLRPEILAIPRYGAVNVHGALLPEYRGPNPTQWALLSDATETGVTMHYMDENFDTGDIITQRRVPIYFDDTWRDIQTRVHVATEKMFEEEIPKLLTGTNTRQPQDEKRAKKWPRRHPEDGLIDWQQSVCYIYNLVRALVKPYPGAFYVAASGKRIVLEEYLTLPQITALKYGKEGGQMLKAGLVALTIPDTDNLQDNAGLMFNICLLEDKKLIGSCQLRNIDHTRRTTELKITLVATSGQVLTYKLEAAGLALKFAFKDLHLQYVYMNVLSDDTEAIQLYIKAGFKKEDIIRDDVRYSKKQKNYVTMGIKKDDYAV